MDYKILEPVIKTNVRQVLESMTMVPVMMNL